MIFTNTLGIYWLFLSFLPSLAVCLLLQPANDSILMLLTALLMILLDLSWRALVDTNPQNWRLVTPRSGGHLSFIPTWIWGFLIVVQLVTTGAV